MSKSVTVNFADGTTHVYDDVPDEVSNDEVNQRAQQDFSKPIQAVGAPSPTEKATENYNNSNMLDKFGGVVAAGSNLVGQALTSPVGVAAEALLGKQFLYDPLVDAIKNRGGPIAPQTMPPAGMQQAAQTAAQNTGTYGAPRTPNLRVAPSNAGAQAFEQMGQQLTRPQPTQPGIIQQGMDYANKIRQLAYEKAMQGAKGVGTAIESAAPTAGAIASRMAPYVKAGGALGAMSYSAPLGPKVPMQGPYKGMEINPMSGRPWTLQELQQINR